MKKLLLFLSCLQGIVLCTAAPPMRFEDKVRIKEAITISTYVGDKIWKGINDVPFVVLLVTDSTEYLINHPYPSGDFKSLGHDSLLNTTVYSRERKFPNWYLATFPAVNGVPCIVVGTPENTGKTSPDWVITLVHEHFHQFQFGSPDYFSAVQALGLSGGDESGMWQLNYAFPYDSANVVAQYKRYTAALSTAVLQIGNKKFPEAYKLYTTERNKFRNLLKPADYRYFSFQLWQEGLARYTEYKYLQALAGYKTSPAMIALPDYSAFSTLGPALYNSEMKALVNAELPTEKRVCFYSIGFAEGLLLDHVRPGWHADYLAKKFLSRHIIRIRSFQLLR